MVRPFSPLASPIESALHSLPRGRTDAPDNPRSDAPEHYGVYQRGARMRRAKSCTATTCEQPERPRRAHSQEHTALDGAPSTSGRTV